MTKLAWNAIGERVFEAGIDRGVLFVTPNLGVPWNGLISVSESPSGGEVTPYYIDGIKYLNVVSNEEFEATIEAYTYPPEFEQCDGTSSILNGLSVTQQNRRSFGLCYRTLVGNDVEGIDYGYKIHLVYGATATPNEKAHATVAESIDPDNFSWKIVTKPPTFIGYKPSAHFVVDSRETPAELLAQFENILYGTETNDSRMPSVPELISLFTLSEDILDGGLLVDEYDDVFDGGAP